VKLSDIMVNATAIEQGEWIGKAHGTPIPGMGDLCLKVRGTANSDYRTLMAKLSAAIPRAKKISGSVTPQEVAEMVATCLSETVLLDWSGLDDENGPLPFSKPMAFKMLVDPRMAPFKDAVEWAGEAVGAINTAADEAAAKN